MVRAGLTAIGVAALGIWSAAAPAVESTGYHNVHLRVADPAAAADWYIKHLGATKAPPPYAIAFGRTVVAFVRTDKAAPSAGSVIDHIGLSYPDLRAKMKDFEAGGAKVVTPLADAKGLFTYGFIEDPWGVKIEVMQDSELLGFHHVHLRVPDPAATLSWYHDMLGGQRGKLRGLIEGLRYGDVWLLASRSTEPVVPSADRAIMNIAVEVADVDAATAALAARGVTVTTKPSQAGPVRYSFLDDPNGVRFELVHHPGR